METKMWHLQNVVRTPTYPNHVSTFHSIAPGAIHVNLPITARIALSFGMWVRRTYRNWIASSGGHWSWVNYLLASPKSQDRPPAKNNFSVLSSGVLSSDLFHPTPAQESNLSRSKSPSLYLFLFLRRCEFCSRQILTKTYQSVSISTTDSRWFQWSKHTNESHQERRKSMGLGSTACLDPPNEDRGFQYVTIWRKKASRCIVGCFICSKVHGSLRLAVLRTERKRANHEPRTWHGLHEVQGCPGMSRMSSLQVAKSLLRVC